MLISMESLPIFVAHGVNFTTPEGREDYIKKWKEHLTKLFS